MKIRVFTRKFYFSIRLPMSIDVKLWITLPGGKNFSAVDRALRVRVFLRVNYGPNQDIIEKPCHLRSVS